MRRVDEAMRQVLGDALAQELKDPRIGFVNVTDVKTSPDLRHARVYVTVLGDEDVREARKIARTSAVPTVSSTSSGASMPCMASRSSSIAR